MKTSALILTSLLAASTFLAACEGKKMKVVSDADADAIIASDLSGTMGGSAMLMNAAGRICTGWEPFNGCGQFEDSTNNTGGKLAAFFYHGWWSWEKNCSFGVPLFVEFVMEGTTEFHGDEQIEENIGGYGYHRWALSDLDTSFSEYTLNGRGLVISGGALNVNHREKHYSYTDSLTYTNVKIRKSDHAIVGGGGTARIFGSIGRMSSNDFDRKGSFVFHPDGTYTLTMDNGSVFTRPQ